MVALKVVALSGPGTRPADPRRTCRTRAGSCGRSAESPAHYMPMSGRRVIDRLHTWYPTSQ